MHVTTGIRGFAKSKRFLAVFGLAMLFAGRGFCAKMAGPLGPSAIVASGSGETLYVAATDARRVAIVDLSSRELVASIELPARPTGLALSPDDKTLYVTCAAPRSVVVAIDTGTRKKMWDVEVGHTAVAPVVTPDGRRLFVCNRFNNDVSVLDLIQLRQTARVPVTREPIAAAVTSDGRTLVVGNHLPAGPSTGPLVCAVVTLVDTASLRTQTVDLPDGSTNLRDVCITPDNRYALVAHVLGNYELVASHLDQGWMNTNAMSVIDLRARQFVGNVLLDDFSQGAANSRAIAVSPDGTTICVAHAGTHDLSLIETAPVLERVRRERHFRGPMNDPSAVTDHRRRVSLPGRGPRDIALAGSQVYVAEYFSDTLAVLPLDSPPGVEPTTMRLGPKPKLSRVRLGEMLFNDATFCFEQWQSCASCHPDGRADGLNWDLVNDGIGNPKNTKSMLLAHRTPPAMISGVRPTAEMAVRAGMEHILYADVPEEHMAAIDEYLTSLTPIPSPQLVDGRRSEAAQRGQRLFEDQAVGCASCHPAPLYTDLKKHRVSPPGIHEHLVLDTPTLIEAWRTAPYSHDGRFTTIKALLVEGRHGRSRGGVETLSSEKIDDLVQFVLSL